ncbi:hypothetical protein B0H14DRAFT_2896581 [Mycena olivaceomarginata]|nr:hypothetical protein B0H14DRAFT_2896581 [Mycena olivaceomarginata]
MPAPVFTNPTNVPVMAVAVLMMVVFHAVQPGVLALASPSPKDWRQTVASFIEHNKVPLQEKANTITTQVAAVVGAMKHRNIIPQLNPQHLPWEFSDEEATIFATELSQFIVANLM